jgi:hypothetical protein
LSVPDFAALFKLRIKFGLILNQRTLRGKMVICATAYARGWNGFLRRHRSLPSFISLK